jgi:hypothetical protein
MMPIFEAGNVTTFFLLAVGNLLFFHIFHYHYVCFRSLVTTENYELQKNGKWHVKRIGWGGGGITGREWESVRSQVRLVETHSLILINCNFNSS